ncbi:MAG: TrmB family transcriptional regulator [Candidatus Asgardarchaeum californiense]|nr:MAG: TrmB family transcriptional regulator [Candidatus Asgardarchaeum californiense]
MRESKIKLDNATERALLEILKSKAESRIYIYLLRKNGAKTEDIIEGTKLHPSTVRELLSRMYEKKLIYREKLKNDSIGKNPYLYRAVSPIGLLQRYANEIEIKLNRIANLTYKKDGNNRYVEIKIHERVDKI